MPITGVTMPFLSYDPALTVASGGEIGVLVAIALARAPARTRGRHSGRTDRLSKLTDLRFVVVSGKGGVGRTTVAATLARAAAASGKRVLLAAAAATDRLGRMFGQSQPLGPSITTLAPGIDGVNITPASSLHEYGLKVLRSELITRAVFENRAVRGLLGAIPGLDAYALLGKAWWHTTETKEGRPRYDLVVFDGPATGHAALMLRIPQAILNVMPKGPLAGDARAIIELLRDPARAALVIVTLAEESAGARDQRARGAGARPAGDPARPARRQRAGDRRPVGAGGRFRAHRLVHAAARRRRNHGRRAVAGHAANGRGRPRPPGGRRAGAGGPQARSRAADDHAAAHPHRRDRPCDHRRADTAPCGANPIAQSDTGRPKTPQ